MWMTHNEFKLQALNSWIKQFVLEHKWLELLLQLFWGWLSYWEKHTSPKSQHNFQTLFSKSFNFQLRKEELHLITVISCIRDAWQTKPVHSSEMEYANNKAHPFLCHRRATHRVNMKQKRIIIVASNLISNIFFRRFSQPIKSSYWLKQHISQGVKLQKVLCHQEPQQSSCKNRTENSAYKAYGTPFEPDAGIKRQGIKDLCSQALFFVPMVAQDSPQLPHGHCLKPHHSH